MTTTTIAGSHNLSHTLPYQAQPITIPRELQPLPTKSSPLVPGFLSSLNPTLTLGNPTPHLLPEANHSPILETITNNYSHHLCFV
ncbi:hypothetical protein E2C01_086989 [Portunus trituberculatus]|uniref:Uncharacterized protein n=1 Tax=Portunus trituberculatus TaxID=210409 RepID=A0A5B7JHV8_PORTR|nr:hypothetical protein [Portunus trituberculatus]